MAKRLHHGKCTVRGCTNEEKSLFSLPSSEPLKMQWLNFIYSGDIPTHLPKNVNVCAKHFSDVCFHNLGQYRGGFAQNLKLKTGSIPTLHGSTAIEQVSHRVEAASRLPLACHFQHQYLLLAYNLLATKTVVRHAPHPATRHHPSPPLPPSPLRSPLPLHI